MTVASKMFRRRWNILATLAAVAAIYLTGLTAQ